jgi:hypothetical protein
MTTMTSLANTAYTLTYNTDKPYFDATTDYFYFEDPNLEIAAWSAESTADLQTDFVPGAKVTQGKIKVTITNDAASADGGVTWTTKRSVAQICGDTADWGSA